MKRLAWLLLALSLPAWATINGVDSSRILIPCTEGQRMGEYPAGGACNPPAVVDYLENWSQFIVGDGYSKINTGTRITIVSPSKTDSSTYSFVTSPSRDGNKSLLIANDGTVVDAGGVKHRAEVRYARNLTDFDTFNIGEEYCIGYSLRLSSTGWPDYNNSTSVFVGQLARDNPYLLFNYQDDGDSDGYVRANVQRKYGASASSPLTQNFYYAKGVDGNTSSAVGADGWKLDRWYDVVINIIHSPADASGTLKIYVIDTSDATETVLANLTGTQIGFADDISEPFWKMGVYWGADTRSTTYRVHYGPMRMKKGSGCKAVVTPSGTPS